MHFASGIHVGLPPPMTICSGAPVGRLRITISTSFTARALELACKYEEGQSFVKNITSGGILNIVMQSCLMRSLGHRPQALLPNRLVPETRRAPSSFGLESRRGGTSMQRFGHGGWP